MFAIWKWHESPGYGLVPMKFIFVFSLWIGSSVSRDLRPSEHGLFFQNLSGVQSPEMKKFFLGSSPPHGAPVVELPEAKNTSDPLSSTELLKRKSNNRVMVVLLIVCLTLAVVGIVFAAAGIHLFISSRMKRQEMMNRGKSLDLLSPRTRLKSGALYGDDT